MANPLQSVCVRRLIKGSPARVFDAFSSTEALSLWFSPSPDISVQFEEFAFREQGKFRLLYRMPDGTQPNVNGKFEIVERPRQIAFSWNWEEPDPHANIPMLVIIRFIAKRDCTEINLTHEKLPQSACERHAAGWESTLDRLEPYFLTISVSNLHTEKQND